MACFRYIQCKVILPSPNTVLKHLCIPILIIVPMFPIPHVPMLPFPGSSDVDKAVIRPLPRAKRVLSEANTLPHIVQLLLTFDPRLVERVVTLLNLIMEVGGLQLELWTWFQSAYFIHHRL